MKEINVKQLTEILVKGEFTLIWKVYKTEIGMHKWEWENIMHANPNTKKNKSIHGNSSLHLLT